MKITVTQLVRGAVIAALYATLTIVASPISFGPVQFRVSEAMTVLPFIFPEAIIGLSIGCFLSNIIGSTLIDAIFGTLATLLAAIVTAKCKKLWLAPLPPVIFNGAIVGLVVTLMTVEFSWMNYLFIALSIAASEIVVCYACGIPLLIAVNSLGKKHKFFR